MWGQVCGEGRWKRGGVVFVKETRCVVICKTKEITPRPVRGPPTFPQCNGAVSFADPLAQRETFTSIFTYLPTWSYPGKL